MASLLEKREEIVRQLHKLAADQEKARAMMGRIQQSFFNKFSDELVEQQIPLDSPIRLELFKMYLQLVVKGPVTLEEMAAHHPLVWRICLLGSDTKSNRHLLNRLSQWAKIGELKCDRRFMKDERHWRWSIGTPLPDSGEPGHLDQAE